MAICHWPSDMTRRHLRLLVLLLLLVLLVYAVLRNLSAHYVIVLGQYAGGVWQPVTVTDALTRNSTEQLQVVTTDDGVGDFHHSPVYHSTSNHALSPADLTVSDHLTDTLQPTKVETTHSVRTVSQTIRLTRAASDVAVSDWVTKSMMGTHNDGFSDNIQATSSEGTELLDAVKALSIDLSKAEQQSLSFSVTKSDLPAAQQTFLDDSSTLPYSPSPEQDQSEVRGGKAGLTPASPHPRLFNLFHKSLQRGNQEEEEVTSARYMVYLCEEEGVRCGGWADRQRGMLSVSLLARVTGRKFKVDMRTPCNVTNFMQPTGQDWWEWESGVNTGTMVVINDKRRSVLPRLLLNNVDLNIKYPHTKVYVQTTRDLAPLLARSDRYRQLLPAWARDSSQAARFRQGWPLLATPTSSINRRLHSLFGHLNQNVTDKTSQSSRNQSGHKTNKSLQLNSVIVSDSDGKHLNSNTNSSTTIGSDGVHRHFKLVCAHLRMGRNPSMPDDNNVRNDAEAVQLTFTFLQNLLESKTDYVFIATDDQGVRQAARNTFGVQLLDHGGTIVHIDKQRTLLHACAGFETAVLDQLVLSQCDVLVMSGSGFSRHSAYLRHHKDGLFLLDGGLIVPCSLE